MGAQLGRSLNAFKKGMSELNHNVIDSTATTMQQEEIKALEARRLELEILEREIALKKAELASREGQQGGEAIRNQ